MFKLSIIAALVAASIACAQMPNVPTESPQYYLSGEHYPVIHTGVGTIFGAAHPCTTAWVQVGYSPNASKTGNRNIGRFNPEQFTASLKLACLGLGDSAKVSAARFESAYDTTVAPMWNGDSSNVFVMVGAFSREDYGRWRFEPLADTSRTKLYPLRLLIGGYARLIVASNIADTCRVSWRIVGEN